MQWRDLLDSVGVVVITAKGITMIASVDRYFKTLYDCLRKLVACHA